MKVAGDPDADRKLRVEVGRLFACRRFEQFKLQPAAEPRLVDIGQQGVHFRLVWQLLQERSERLLDFMQLLDVELEIDRFRLFGRVLVPERDLLGLRAIERVVLVLPIEQCPADQDGNEDGDEREQLRQQRPVADLAEVEAAKVVEAHTVPFFAAGAGGGAPGVAGASGLNSAGGFGRFS